MKCIFCGSKFCSSIEDDKVCTTCERAIKQLGLNMRPDRIKELAQADQSGRLVVLPCKIGDAVWTIKNFKGHERARIGYVSELFFTKYMKLFIVVKSTGRGFWGEGVFPSEAEAVAALERRKEVDEHRPAQA